MASKKAIVAVSVIAVFAVIAVLFLWRPSPNGKTIFEDTIEPVIIYTPNLVVNGYESDGHWTRSMTTNLPEYVSTVSCSVSNTGNAEAQDVNFEIRVDGELFGTEFVSSIPVQGRRSYSYTISMPYDSSRTIEVKSWCSESSDISTFSINHEFPRYWDENPDILKLFITPNEFNVVLKESQIIDSKFFLTPNWMAIRDWVSDNIEYRYDSNIYGTEHWQFPLETLRLGTGDCEDFSILTCSLLRANGWSTNDVFVVLGKNGDNYHAWVKIDMGILGWYNLEPQGGSWNLVIGDFLMLSGYTPIYQFNDLQVQKLG